MAFKMKGFEPGNKKKLSIKIGKATPLKKGFFGDLKEAVKTIPKAAKELGGQWKKMLTRKKK